MFLRCLFQNVAALIFHVVLCDSGYVAELICVVSSFFVLISLVGTVAEACAIDLGSLFSARSVVLRGRDIKRRVEKESESASKKNMTVDDASDASSGRQTSER